MKIQTVCVYGAGLMGHGIAQVTAAAGCSVFLRDRDEKVLEGAMQRVHKALGKRVTKNKLTEEEAAATLNRIVTTMSAAPSATAPLSLEPTSIAMAPVKPPMTPEARKYFLSPSKNRSAFRSAVRSAESLKADLKARPISAKPKVPRDSTSAGPSTMSAAGTFTYQAILPPEARMAPATNPKNTTNQIQ